MTTLIGLPVRNPRRTFFTPRLTRGFIHIQTARCIAILEQIKLNTKVSVAKRRGFSGLQYLPPLRFGWCSIPRTFTILSKKLANRGRCEF